MAYDYDNGFNLRPTKGREFDFQSGYYEIVTYYLDGLPICGQVNHFSI